MVTKQKAISKFEEPVKNRRAQTIIILDANSILISFTHILNYRKLISISLYSINSKTPIASLETLSSLLNSAYLSPDTRFLLTTHQKSYLILWDFYLSQILKKFNVFYMLTKPLPRIKPLNRTYPAHNLDFYSFQNLKKGLKYKKNTLDSRNILLNNRTTLKLLENHLDIEYNKAISTFILLTIENSVSVWNILNNQLILLYFHEDHIENAQFTKDLLKVVSLSISIIKVWDLHSRTILYNILNIQTVPESLSFISFIFDIKLKLQLFKIPPGKYQKLYKLYQKIILRLFKKSSTKLKSKLHLEYLIKLWYPDRSTLLSEPQEPSEHIFQLITPSKSQKYLAISTKYSVLITKSSPYHKKLSRFPPFLTPTTHNQS